MSSWKHTLFNQFLKIYLESPISLNFYIDIFRKWSTCIYINQDYLKCISNKHLPSTYIIYFPQCSYNILCSSIKNSFSHILGDSISINIFINNLNIWIINQGWKISNHNYIYHSLFIIVVLICMNQLIAEMDTILLHLVF